MEISDSLNPYQNLQFLAARTPEELVAMIRSIGAPIKILAFVAGDGRHTAYFVSDVKIKRKVKGAK